MKYCCLCGMRYSNRSHLVEHIGTGNPRWPRCDDGDEHMEISQQQWLNKFRPIARTLGEE